MNNCLGLNESGLSLKLLTLALGLPRLLAPLYYSRDILALLKTDPALSATPSPMLFSCQEHPFLRLQLQSSMEIENSSCTSALCQPRPLFWPHLGYVLCLLEFWDGAEALGGPSLPGMGQAQKGACGWLRDTHPPHPLGHIPGGPWAAEAPTPAVQGPSVTLVSVQGLHVSRGGAAAPGLFLFP